MISVAVKIIWSAGRPGENSVIVGVDSDLEAFSHNPADVSFATCRFRQQLLPFIRRDGSSRTESHYRDRTNLTVG